LQAEGNYNNQGLQINHWTWYYMNGQIEIKGQYANGDKSSRWYWYDKKGKLLQTGVYRKGKKTGKWSIYNSETGKLKIMDNYQTKKWTYYNEKGKPTKIINTIALEEEYKTVPTRSEENVKK